MNKQEKHEFENWKLQTYFQYVLRYLKEGKGDQMGAVMSGVMKRRWTHLRSRVLSVAYKTFLDAPHMHESLVDEMAVEALQNDPTMLTDGRVVDAKGEPWGEVGNLYWSTLEAILELYPGMQGEVRSLLSHIDYPPYCPLPESLEALKS